MKRREEQGCIGIVEYLNAKENEFEWWWKIRKSGTPLYTKELFLEGILVTQAESHGN